MQYNVISLKHIVIFGAGKSSIYLVEYLIERLLINNWKLTLLDANAENAQSKIGNAQNAYAASVNARDGIERAFWIASADIVISLLPPLLHSLIAKDCVHFRKNLLTASYIDEEMEALRHDIEKQGLLFIGEMGLDPGIDHMSAMQIIHDLERKGAKVTSFRSHCGGLVAPESDDNPWRYKISWNPANIVNAGKTGAVYRENNTDVYVGYADLFDVNNTVDVPTLGTLAWYPNRDSLRYISQYNLHHGRTFIRTTLRHPEFCFGWKNMIQLKLTDEHITYDTDGMTIKQFFQQHLNQHGFSEWIEQQLTSRFVQTKMLLEKLQELLSAEEQVDEEQMKELQEFMMVDDSGKLLDVNLEEVKSKAAATVAGQMHEASLSMKQLFFLGMDDDITVINKGRCSTAEILQFILEKKLALKEGDRDMIVMLHEIDYEIAGKHSQRKSCLIIKGEDHIHTAMAKTVGLPLAVAAELVLQEKITVKGLHIPVIPEIYEPVLSTLRHHGIGFFES